MYGKALQTGNAQKLRGIKLTNEENKKILEKYLNKPNNIIDKR